MMTLKVLLPEFNKPYMELLGVSDVPEEGLCLSGKCRL